MPSLILALALLASLILGTLNLTTMFLLMLLWTLGKFSLPLTHYLFFCNRSSNLASLLQWFS